MVLLREVIGDALRARRQGQHRTLREVSSAANVSLGYLSEIERGQKEASSELLASICEALGARLSEVLREVSDTVALAEQLSDVTGQEQPAQQQPVARSAARRQAVGKPVSRDTTAKIALPAVSRPTKLTIDGDVAVAVHQESPLKATLRTTRNTRADDRERDVVCAA